MNSYNVVSVVGYNTPNKKLLMINGEPVCVCNGEDRVQLLIGYVEGVVSKENIHDKKVIGYLDKYKTGGLINE